MTLGSARHASGAAPKSGARLAVWLVGSGLLGLGFAGGWIAAGLGPQRAVPASEAPSTWPASPFARKASLAHDLETKLWPHYANRRMKVVTHAVFPLAEAAKAHALMESSAHIGKILLEVKRL